MLELGCGTGRVLFSAASWGLEVTGVDASPQMLDRARSRALSLGMAGRVDLREAEMVDFDLGRKFQSIIAPLNALMHLMDDGSFSACLRRVAAHLLPGGRFFFDLCMPRPEFIADASLPGGIEVRQFKLRGRSWSQRESHSFDPISRISHIHHVFNTINDAPEETMETDLRLRFYGPEDWPPLFKAAGLRILHLFGDFQSSPFDPDTAGFQVGVAGLEPEGD